MLPERRPEATALGPALADDWQAFLSWAEAEGWRVPARELVLYRNELAGSAFVLRDDANDPLGFVTVCRQQRHAWIGNLIVDPVRRGAGFGRRLFEHAVGTLAGRGVATLWLTASADGLPLYTGCGFREAGRVERWAFKASGAARPGQASASGGDLYALARADAAAWGNSRAELLSLLAKGGEVFAAGSTVALLQPGDQLRVLGPWLSADLCPRANRLVLGRVMDAFSGAGELVADVIAGSPVRLLLHAAGFRQEGETVLMMRGEPVRGRLSEIIALASLGSMG